jgi:hypothetical protein
MLGPEHPDTATSLNDLAYLLRDQGDIAKARPLYECALAVREKVLGPEHRNTILLKNAASLFQDQGDPAASAAHPSRALSFSKSAK